VPEHWAVGTAEEQDRRVLHHQVPHDLGVPIGGDHEDKPHEVKYGNIEVASSTISIMKRKPHSTSGSSTLSAERGEASSLEAPKMNAE